MLVKISADRRPAYLAKSVHDTFHGFLIVEKVAGSHEMTLDVPDSETYKLVPLMASGDIVNF